MQKLEALVTQALSDTELELVLLQYRKEGGEWVLRVLIDRPEGIDLDACERASRRISDLFETEDPLSESYRLEVSSPGIDRPLTKEADYQRFVNERVYVKTHGPIDGCKTFTGKLTAYESGFIHVDREADGKSYRIPIERIAKATLKPILDF